MDDSIPPGASVQELSKRMTDLEEYVTTIRAILTSSQFNETNKKNVTSPSRLSEHPEDVKGSHKIEDALHLVKDSFPQAYFRSVMSSMSLPGIKFIGQRFHPKFHTYFWIFVHVFALLVGLILILIEYFVYQRSSLAWTTADDLTLVSDVPFPAITICLPDSFHDGYDYAGSVKKCFLCNTTEDDKCFYDEMCTFDEIASIAVASLICPVGNYRNMSDTPWFVFEQDHNAFFSSEEFSNYAQQVFPSCDINVSQERYTKDDKFINVLYSESGCYVNGYQHFVSPLGMCFTVNGLIHEDIYDKHTVHSLPIERERRWVKSYLRNYIFTGAVFHTDLNDLREDGGNIMTVPAYASEEHTIHIAISDRNHKRNTEFCRPDKSRASTFSFIIHNPMEIPIAYQSDFDLEPGEAKEIRITPKRVTTESGLAVDNCHSAYDKKLAMFKYYSEKNCETECIADCSLWYCGCVPYYLPRHNASVKVCFSTCAQEKTCDCGCLPDCKYSSYTFEVFNKKGNGSDLGLLDIKFKNKGFHATVRTGKTITLSQFVAYSLGIVGVFSGFSVMIVVELFYLLTFKLWYSMKTYLKYKDQ